MAVATRCQTPGARFHVQITPRRVAVSVDVPPSALPLNDDEAAQLDADLHNVVELALSRYWCRQGNSGVAGVQ
jgi:hypothetical protein